MTCLTHIMLYIQNAAMQHFSHTNSGFHRLSVHEEKCNVYLAGVFAAHPRSSTQHVWSDSPPVVIVAVTHYSYVHSTQHRGEVVAENLRHTPAAHCADVIVEWRGVFIGQFSRLDVGVQLHRLTQL